MLKQNSPFLGHIVRAAAVEQARGTSSVLYRRFTRMRDRVILDRDLSCAIVGDLRSARAVYIGTNLDVYVNSGLI